MIIDTLAPLLLKRAITAINAISCQWAARIRIKQP
jgi:hypothetical protein